MFPLNVVAAAGGFRFDINAGNTGTLDGWSVTNGFGSTDPTPVDFSGETIESIFTNSNDDAYQFRMAGNNVPNTNDSWVQYSISGTFVTGAKTILYKRTDFTYVAVAGANTAWTLAGVLDHMINGNLYKVSIV